MFYPKLKEPDQFKLQFFDIGNLFNSLSARSDNFSKAQQQFKQRASKFQQQQTVALTASEP